MVKVHAKGIRDAPDTALPLLPTAATGAPPSAGDHDAFLNSPFRMIVLSSGNVLSCQP